MPGMVEREAGMVEREASAPEPGEARTIVQRIGEHVLSFEPPDLLLGVPCGSITSSDLHEMIAFIEHHAAGLPYVLVLVDVSELGTVASDVRKASGDLSKAFPYRGMAFHGASFQARLFVRLLWNTMNLFSRRDNPAHFASTEAEARAWLLERRRVLNAPGSGS